jgi:hypothetical protein
MWDLSQKHKTNLWGELWIMVNYSWYHSSLECKYFISIRPKFDYRLSIFCKFHLFFYFSFISTTSFFLLLLCFFLFFWGGFGLFGCLFLGSWCWIMVLMHGALTPCRSYRLRHSSITGFAAQLSLLAKSFCLEPIFANIKDLITDRQRGNTIVHFAVCANC